MGSEKGEQCLVLGRAFSRHERQLVLHTAEGDEAPHAHEEVGAAFLAPEHFDEQLLAIAGCRKEAGVAAAAHTHGHQAGHLDARRGQGVVHLGRRRVAARRAERQVQSGTDRPAHSHACDHVEGKVEAAVEPSQSNAEYEPPRRPPDRTADVRTGRGRNGGAHGHSRRREPGAQGHPVADDELGDVVELGEVTCRAGSVDDVLQESGHAVRGPAGDHELDCQPGAPLDKSGEGSGADGDG